MMKNIASLFFVAAVPAFSMTLDNLKSVVSNYTLQDLDLDSIFQNVNNIQPITVQCGNRNFTLDVQVNQDLFANNSDIPEPEKNANMLAGVVRDEPDSFARVCRWAVGLSGVFSFDDATGQTLTFGMEKIDGINQTACYNMEDYIPDATDNSTNTNASSFLGTTAPNSGATETSSRRRLFRRAVPKVANVAFALDKSFLNKFGSSAVSTAKSVVNIASGFYQKAIGMSLRVSGIFSDTSGSVLGSGVIDGYLGTFSRIVKAGNKLPFNSNNVASIQAITFRQRNNGNLGTGFIKTACTVNSQSVLSVKRGGSSSDAMSEVAMASLSAHEMGHVFGANHDGTGNVGCAQGGLNIKNIMNPTLNLDKPSSVFSSCSISQFRSYFSKSGLCNSNQVSNQASASVNLDLVPTQVKKLANGFNTVTNPTTTGTGTNDNATKAKPTTASSPKTTSKKSKKCA